MFTFSYDDGLFSATVTTKDMQIDKVVEAFRQFLLGAGFHPNNVSEALPRE